MNIDIVCSKCRGRNVRRDAYAEWNTLTQEWELQNVFDQGYCEDCGGEASLEEVPLPMARLLDGDKLICPHCGQSDDWKYLEDIQNARDIRSIEDGQLLIESHYETGEGYDDGDNGRLMCCQCCTEFPIPEELEVEFVCG